MLSKFVPVPSTTMAAIACFVVLTGGAAYAANTIRSEDIVDNEVTVADVRNDDLSFGGLTHPDLRPGSVRSSEVFDFTVTDRDVATNTLTGGVIATNAIDTDEVVDGGLTDDDIAQAGGVVSNFLGSIGVVPARSCVERLLSGISAHADHLLLTANSDGSDANLSYTVEYTTAGSGDAFIKVCNPTDNSIDDSFTRFNLLEISGG